MLNAAFLLKAEHFEEIYGQECVVALSGHARVIRPVPLTAEELATRPPPAWLSELDVLFAGWGSPVLDAALLGRMPQLQAVFYGGGTIRPIASNTLWDRGIVVASAAALNAVPVIEFTLGTIFLSFKRAWHHARETRSRRTYEPLHALPVPTGAGATIGLVSLGLIGSGVAERLRACDVRVLAHDPTFTSERAAALGAELVELDELLATADIVSLHTPVLPETRHFINRARLDLMKPYATFINTARGALVREPDLIAFLRDRPDVQAILDVAEPEPPARDSPLYDLPNVFLTPHIAGSIGAERRRMGRAMVAEFLRYVRGEPLQYAVRRDQLAWMA
jgi:phosphoglycerate dehydrogenase-like enzyme